MTEEKPKKEERRFRFTGTGLAKLVDQWGFRLDPVGGNIYPKEMSKDYPLDIEDKPIPVFVPDGDTIIPYQDKLVKDIPGFSETPAFSSVVSHQEYIAKQGELIAHFSKYARECLARRQAGQVAAAKKA